VLIYAYANNHFQGHGPATIAKFLELWAAVLAKYPRPSRSGDTNRHYFRHLIDPHQEIMTRL
jgi:hypothetical protein